MQRVVGNDGLVYGLVDTRKQAEQIIEMKKLGRNGLTITNSGMTTKASTMTFKIEQVADGVHPGY